MPTVPVNERRVQKKASLLSTPKAGVAVEGAFGEDIGKAQAKVGADIASTGVAFERQIVSHANKMREWDERARAANIENEFSAEIDKRIHNTETKDVEKDGVSYTIPAGYLDRTGEQARGSLIEYDSEVKPLITQYSDKVKNPIIRQEMAQRLSSIYAVNRDKINIHESTQWRKSKVDNFEASMVNDTNRASASTSAAELGLYINNIIRTNDTLAAFNGDTDEVKIKRQDETVIKAVTNAAATTLKRTGNLGLAQGMLDSAQPRIPEKDYREISDTLKTYSEKLDAEIKAQKVIAVDMKQAANFDTWASERSKPLAERTLTPQVLKEQHGAREISDEHFTSMLKRLESADGVDRPTDNEIYSQIRSMVSLGYTRPQVIDTIFNHSDKLSNEDTRRLVDHVLSKSDTAENDRINYNVTALNLWSKRNLGDFFGNKDLSSDIVYEFHRRVDKEKAIGIRIDEIAQEVIKDNIKKYNPSTSLMEDAPNYVGGKNGIKKTNEKNSKLKGEVPISKPPATDGSGIDFDDL
jgi:hypothetical protein